MDVTRHCNDAGGETPHPLHSTADVWNTFEWDTEKDSANQRKHDVGFTEASTVFGDALSVTIPEVEVAGEERYIIVGMSSKGNLLVVVHTIGEERIRLIGARPATKHERRNYEETSLKTAHT